MGLLDGKNPKDFKIAQKRRRVLKKNIKALANRHGIDYGDAVEEFGKRIGRSACTIYSWLVERDDGSSGFRPMPGRHYKRMVDVGLLDESI